MLLSRLGLRFFTSCHCLAENDEGSHSGHFLAMLFATLSPPPYPISAPNAHQQRAINISPNGFHARAMADISERAIPALNRRSTHAGRQVLRHDRGRSHRWLQVARNSAFLRGRVQPARVRRRTQPVRRRPMLPNGQQASLLSHEEEEGQRGFGWVEIFQLHGSIIISCFVLFF